MAIKRETLDGLLAGHDPQAVFAKDGAKFWLRVRNASGPVFGFRKTGFWLEELAAPYYVFEDAGAP